MKPSRRRSGPVPLEQVLDGVLQRCGLTARLTQRDRLAAWPEIVGPGAAAHAQAVDLDDGVLTVQADHGAWRQELTLLMPTIIAGFNARFGPDTVREVRWVRPATYRGRGDNQD